MTVGRTVLSIGSRDASSLQFECMCWLMEVTLDRTSRPRQTVRAWESRQWRVGWANSAGPQMGKIEKSPPIWQRAVYNENSIFEQMTVPVIQSVSTPTSLLFLCLLPEACHCAARDEFYKAMPCLLPPRPPRRDHNSLPSPLPQPLSMHFRA